MPNYQLNNVELYKLEVSGVIKNLENNNYKNLSEELIISIFKKYPDLILNGYHNLYDHYIKNKFNILNYIYLNEPIKKIEKFSDTLEKDVLCSSENIKLLSEELNNEDYYIQLAMHYYLCYDTDNFIGVYKQINKKPPELVKSYIDVLSVNGYSLNEIISHIYSNVKTDVLKIRLLNRSCVLLSYANRPNDALQISFTLESEAKVKGDNLMLANAKNAKALAYYKLDKFQEAYGELAQAIKLVDKSSNKKLFELLNNNLEKLLMFI